MGTLDTVRVLRLEHRHNGTGPYQNYHTVSGESSEQHPSPFADGIGWFQVTEGSFFGFENMVHLCIWFDERFRREILSYSVGYDITVYEVPRKRVFYGRHQLVFLRDEAVKIGGIPLSPKFNREAVKRLLNR